MKVPNKSYRQSPEQGGFTLGEIALSLPLLLLTVLGILDLKTLLYVKTALSSVAHEMSRCVFPTQGECSEVSASTNLRTYRWWLSNEAQNDLPLGLVFGPRAQVPLSVSTIQGGRSYSSYEEVTASGIGHYLLMSSPRISLESDSFLSEQGEVLRHLYRISNATELLSTGSLPFEVSSSNPRLLSLSISNPFSQNVLSLPCSTDIIEGRGAYRACPYSPNSTRIPVIILIRGRSLRVASSGSSPRVRLRYRSGRFAGDLGGRIISTFSEESHFVPRGASLEMVPLYLRRAPNVEQEFDLHQEIFLDFSKENTEAQLELEFWIEGATTSSSPQWMLESLKVYGAKLEDAATPSLSCSLSRIYTATLPADQNSCDIGVTINGRLLRPSSVKVKGQAPPQKSLGCFSTPPLVASQIVVDEGGCNQVEKRFDCEADDQFDKAKTLYSLKNCDFEYCRLNRSHFCCLHFERLFDHCNVPQGARATLQSLSISTKTEVFPERFISPGNLCSTEVRRKPRSSELPSRFQNVPWLTYDKVGEIKIKEFPDHTEYSQVRPNEIECKKSGLRFSIDKDTARDRYLGESESAPGECYRKSCRREEVRDKDSSKNTLSTILKKAETFGSQQLGKLLGGSVPLGAQISVRPYADLRNGETKGVEDNDISTVEISIKQDISLKFLFGRRISVVHQEKVILEPG